MSAKVVNLDLRRFLKRVEAAADAFPVWVLDAERRPVRAKSIHHYAEFKRDFEKNCRVASTIVGKRSVSTVFLGTDMGYGMSKQPLLFETIIFGPGQSDVVDRYATWEEAAGGHLVAVSELMRGA